MLNKDITQGNQFKKRNIMQKQFTQFKSVIQGFENLFHFENGGNTSIAKEALLECLKWIGQIEDQAKAIAEAQAAEKSPEETPQPTE